MEWVWEKLLAEDPKVMDGTWSAFIPAAHWADDVLVDSREAVLECGYTY